MKNWSPMIAAACAVSFSVAPAWAQQAPAAAQNASAAEPAWKLVCPPAPAPVAGAAAPAPAAPTCVLLQNLLVGEQKQRLLTLIVKRTAPTGNALTIALPHGVLFPPGIALQIDEAAERKLLVQTSDANGAYAGTAIEADLLAALQAGKMLKVTFSSGTGQRIMVPVTLQDFAPGMVALGKTPLPAPATPTAPAPR